MADTARTDPKPAPQPDGSYAHDIYGPDGRKIEAYSPAPLSQEEVAALLAQSYAERPDLNELRQAIMAMDGPELPVATPPAHVAPTEPPYQPPPSAPASSVGNEWSSYQQMVQMLQDPGMQSELMPAAGAADQRMLYDAMRVAPPPTGQAGPAIPTARSVPGLRVEKDAPSVDQALDSLQNRQWWNTPESETVPPEYQDLLEPQ